MTTDIVMSGPGFASQAFSVPENNICLECGKAYDQTTCLHFCPHDARQFHTTRDDIKTEALKLRGIKFLHQGRNPEVGIDCVGFLVVLGQRLGYPEIFDVEGYRRTPSASTIRQLLLLNCDEVPIDKCGVGDIFLMRMHGIKPRHVSVMIRDFNDPLPGIVHANYNGIREDYFSNFPRSWYVAGFRIRGLRD